jgi:PD-(D/E)XK endonuclease
MNEELAEDGVAGAETITIWAGAEDWDRGRRKKGLGAKSGSKARSKSRSKSRSKAADRSVRSTRAISTGADEASASPPGRLDPKQLGEIAEAEFIAKVVGLRFVAAKPWGDSEPFDYIVNMRRTFNFWRVQVKSAHVVGRDGTYSFGAHNGARRSYTAEDIDALVAYVRPERAWYVLPVRVVEGLKGLKLSPGSRGQRSKYEKYREAWDILRKPVRRRRRKK